MLETEALAGSAEGEGFVARTVVGHHSLNLDAQAGIVSDSHLEEGDSASLFLVLHDLAERDPGGIVDADMDKLPSDSFAARAQIALASTIAGDAMADPIELPELFDVDVDQFTRTLPLVAPHRLGRLQGRQLV